ncbi:MAG: peptidylprolyl isomerase [Nodosilinea sp. LVE1205-7]|jgi:parvulin-like peptidyl-prolyl isomerase
MQEFVAGLEGLSITHDRVVDHLRCNRKLKDLYCEILINEIIDRVSGEQNLRVAAEEIQFASDQFRYDHKLESATQTLAWLKEQMLTPEDWERGIKSSLLRQKLASHLFADQVEVYFARHKVQYQVAIVYRLVVAEQALAQELLYQVEEEELSFFEACHRYDADQRRRMACGLEGPVSRWQLQPDRAAMIFGAKPKEVLGPIQSEVGFELLYVDDFIQPELTATIRQEILDRLFNEWLESELNYMLYNR